MRDIVFVHVRPAIGQVYGGEKSSLATAEGIARNGFRSSFLLTARDDLARELEEQGIPYLVVPAGDPLDGLRRAPWREQLRKVRDLVRINAAVWRKARGGGTIVHTAAIPGFLCSYFGAKLAGAPVIYHVRTASRGQRTRWFEELSILLADRTVTVSRSLRDQLLDTGHSWLRGAIAGRIEAVYNGFDFAEVDDWVAEHSRASSRVAVGRSSSELMLLLVGGVFADKGQLRFLEQVMPALVTSIPRVHLTCIGGVKDPAYAEACQAAVVRLGLAPYVTFLGYKPLQEVWAWYRAADIAVLPSEREGLPRCAIEAASFGVPVVATSVVGSVEAICSGETGYLVPDEDVGAMAKRIIELAQDPSLRLAMGQRGAAYVRAEFSIERNIREISHIYEQLSR